MIFTPNYFQQLINWNLDLLQMHFYCSIGHWCIRSFWPFNIILHFSLIHLIWLNLINNWIKTWYIALIITENRDPQSFSQIPIQNSSNSLKKFPNFFHLVLQNSSFFVLSLVLIFTCRYYWTTVEEELWKNLAKSWLLHLELAHGSWRSRLIQEVSSWIITSIHLPQHHRSSVSAIGSLIRTISTVASPRGMNSNLPILEVSMWFR